RSTAIDLRLARVESAVVTRTREVAVTIDSKVLRESRHEYLPVRDDGGSELRELADVVANEGHPRVPDHLGEIGRVERADDAGPSALVRAPVQRMGHPHDARVRHRAVRTERQNAAGKPCRRGLVALRYFFERPVLHLVSEQVPVLSHHIHSLLAW